MNQSLFDVRPTDPATSHEAADHAQKSKCRQAVLDTLSALGPMNDDRLVRCLAMFPPGSVIKRRGELVRDGMVSDTGKRQNTQYGRLAIVWEAL